MKIEAKQMNKKRILYLILFVILLESAIIGYMYQRDNIEIDQEIMNCISDNSILFIQEGCHFCDAQEDKFGKYYNQLSIVDCLKELNRAYCEAAEIKVTPTWVINHTQYIGVYEIEDLQNITGCGE